MPCALESLSACLSAGSVTLLLEGLASVAPRPGWGCCQSGRQMTVLAQAFHRSMTMMCPVPLGQRPPRLDPCVLGVREQPCRGRRTSAQWQGDQGPADPSCGSTCFNKTAVGLVVWLAHPQVRLPIPYAAACTMSSKASFAVFSVCLSRVITRKEGLTNRVSFQVLSTRTVRLLANAGCRLSERHGLRTHKGLYLRALVNHAPAVNPRT